MKRVFLFVAVNLAVMFLLMLAVNVILSLAGPDVRESMYHGGIDMFSLGVFSLVFGMGGAFISLLISKPMAKWSVGAQVIDGTEGERERWLVATVERLARTANIKMPEVAIYRGAPNAFATGAFRNSALVAVSDRPRGEPRRQWRHGYAYPGAGSAECCGAVPLPHDCLCGGQRDG